MAGDLSSGGRGVILGVLGIKRLVSGLFHLPTSASLGDIVGVLTVTVVASLRAERAADDVGSST